MKKLVILFICLLTLSISAVPSATLAVGSHSVTYKSDKQSDKTDTLNKTQVYNDLKELYNRDIKGIVKYSSSKADSLIGKSFDKLMEATNHTYNVLKTQQLVKSLHHLFYWILAIFISIIFYRRLKAYRINENSDEIWLIVVIGIIDIALFIYNGTNFMELWTGFINPEYGVMMEILGYLQ